MTAKGMVVKKLVAGAFFVLVMSVSALAAENRFDSLCLQYINQYRAEANERELAIYGSVVKWRAPLTLAPELTQAAKLWLRLLKGVDQLLHDAPTDLLGDQKLAQAVDVNDDNFVTVEERHLYCGYDSWISSECGALSPWANKAPSVAYAWYRSGWHDDPRKATKHYAILIHPFFTEFGAAFGDGYAGKKRAYAEFGYRGVK